MHMFITEPVRKKTEKDMNKLQNKMVDSKLKMQVIADGGYMPVVEWSVYILLDNQKMAAGMIIINKKNN